MLRNVTLVVVCAFLLFSCYTEREDKISGNQLCPEDPTVTYNEKVDTLNFIIETSGSMKGFMPSSASQTSFQRTIDDLLTNLEANTGDALKKVSYYSAQDRIYKESGRKIQNMLRQGLKNAGSSTAIPQLLKLIAANYTSGNQVSIFVSDFIYAPPNINDREYIGNDIRRALSSIRSTNTAVAVFASTSDFKGVYYPAVGGGPVSGCCDEEVPYYVWVMGPSKKVWRVMNDVMKRNFDQVATFGISLPEPAHGIIPGSGRTGSWYLTKEEDAKIVLDNPREIKQDGLRYTIGLNLKSYPQAIANVRFLEDQLSAVAENGKAAIDNIYSVEDFLATSDINNKDREYINCFTHFIEVNVNEVFNKRESIRVNLVLKTNQSKWVSRYTTKEDGKVDVSKTYALEDMLEGVKEMYKANKGIFSITTEIDFSR